MKTWLYPMRKIRVDGTIRFNYLVFDASELFMSPGTTVRVYGGPDNGWPSSIRVFQQLAGERRFLGIAYLKRWA